MLHENFFVQSANNRNSSESATPARMEMENKSLYLVEELPANRLAASLLKQISANDSTFGRQLYSRAKKIEVLGKLIINTNHCPNIPGEDIASWDRMVLIPWDVRYAPDESKVDREKWILPSDPRKVEYIGSLTNAFITVCLNAIHGFYKQSLVEGVPRNVAIPIPSCVSELVAKKREEAFPLIPFIKKYMVPTPHEYEEEDIKAVFYAYSRFLTIRRKKVWDSIDTFMLSLAKGGLETRFDSDLLESFVVGHKLNAEGRVLFEEGTVVISGDMNFSYQPEKLHANKRRKAGDEN